MHHYAESLGALNLFSCNLMVPSPTGDDGRVMWSGYKKKKSEALLSCPPLTSLCAAWFLTVTDQYSTWPGGCAPLPYTTIGTQLGGWAPLPYTNIGTWPGGWAPLPYTTICLCIHPLMNTWAVLTFWLFWKVLHKYACMILAWGSIFISSGYLPRRDITTTFVFDALLFLAGILVCHFSPLASWRRKWQPTPVFLPGESQGQRSPVGCRMWDGTESDVTDVT